MNAIVQVQRQLPRGPAWQQELQADHSAARGMRPLLYILLSLVPSATLMSAWMRYRDAAQWLNVPAEGVIVMAVALWFAELTMVPLLVRCAHVMGGAPAPGTAHYRVEFLEAFAPPVLMLAPLSLAVPALSVFAVAATFVAAGMMLFIGRYGDHDRDADRPAFTGLSWRVVELGFAGWAAVALLVALA